MLLGSCFPRPGDRVTCAWRVWAPGRHIPHVAYLCPVHRVVVRRVLRLRLRLALRLGLLCQLLLLLQLLMRLPTRLRRPGSRPNRNLRTPLAPGLRRQDVLLLLLLLLLQVACRLTHSTQRRPGSLACNHPRDGPPWRRGSTAHA